MKELFKIISVGFLIFFVGGLSAEDVITVGAAASLTNVMEDLKTDFERNFPDIKVRITYAATGALMAQIQNGAPIDVFASANKRFGSKNSSDYAKVLVSESVKVMCYNALVFAVKKNADLSANLPLGEILTNRKMRRIGIGNPSYVPAGKYAQKLLKNKKLWMKVIAKTIHGSNVRQVLAWLEQGAIDGGFVYSTDIAVSNKLKVLKKYETIAGEKLVYPIGVTKRSKKIVAAKKFIDFITSKKARKIFSKYGFITGRKP